MGLDRDELKRIYNDYPKTLELKVDFRLNL